MTKQISFTKYEHKVLPNFRQNINKAESTEDVKKFFVYTVMELLDKVFGGEIKFEYEDLALNIDCDPFYSLSERILSSSAFQPVWNESDLQRVLSRLAESAMHRYKHLQKGSEKTDSKIRM
jgi:hypothetical protein